MRSRIAMSGLGRPTQALGITAALALLGDAAAAAPAAYVDQPATFSDAATQPFRDLNVVHKRAPEVLVRARAAPYDLAGLEACPALKAEIASLDGVLGPDMAAPQMTKAALAKGLATDALSGVVKIPFRGVVRRLSGAEREERERRDAVIAGLSRRAFLKGVVHAKCEGADVPFLQVAAPAVPPPTAVAERQAAMTLTPVSLDRGPGGR